MLPKVDLSIDNCFASKRWTDPDEWLRIIADSGIQWVEASADTECDPLYSDSEYLSEWISNVRKASQKYGVNVANLYSGHGTYATLGLSSNNRQNAIRMRDQWLGKMLEYAADLGCGLGFFCHAFKNSVLQSPELYHQAENELYDDLAILAEKAYQLGVDSVSLEQMYTPHQPPWTIASAKKTLKEVKKRSGRNFYLTIDTGHQSGQKKFLRPTHEMIERQIYLWKKTNRLENVWMGPEKAYEMIRMGASVDEINSFLSDFSYLFSNPEDSDTYHWLKELGAYSPIVHLQQTDGKQSAHNPFMEPYNSNGIIHPEPVISALHSSYEKEIDNELPDYCGKHYLTLEIFTSTACLPKDAIERISASADYWKKHPLLRNEGLV